MRPTILLVALLACLAPAWAEAVTTHVDTLQNGVNGYAGIEETMIRKDNDGDVDTTRNFGAHTPTNIGYNATQNKVARLLWRFSLGADFPRTRKITKVTLGMKWASKANVVTYELYPVLRPCWEQGVDTGLAKATSGATWCAWDAQVADPESLWTTAGVEDVTDRVASSAVTITDDPAVVGWHEYDITALFALWDAGTYPMGGGVLMQATNEATASICSFYTSDAVTVANRPYLIVEWHDTADEPRVLGGKSDLLTLAPGLGVGGGGIQVPEPDTVIGHSRFVYSCDAHYLNHPRAWQSTWRSVQRCFPQPDAWIVNGDLYQVDAVMVDSVKHMLDTLWTAGIPVYRLRGDHDAALDGWEHLVADSLDMWRFWKQVAPEQTAKSGFWEIGNVRVAWMQNTNNTPEDSFFVNSVWRPMGAHMEPAYQETLATGFAAYDSFAVAGSSTYEGMKGALQSAGADIDWKIAMIAHAFASPAGSEGRMGLSWGQYGPKAAGGTIGSIIEANAHLCLAAHEHTYAEYVTRGDTTQVLGTAGSCRFVIGPPMDVSHDDGNIDTCTTINGPTPPWYGSPDSCRCDTVRATPGSWITGSGYYNPLVTPIDGGCWVAVETWGTNMVWTVRDTLDNVRRRVYDLRP